MSDNYLAFKKMNQPDSETVYYWLTDETQEDVKDIVDDYKCQGYRLLWRS